MLKSDSDTQDLTAAELQIMTEVQDYDENHSFVSNNSRDLQSFWHIIMAACTPQCMETWILFNQEDFQLAKQPLKM